MSRFNIYTNENILGGNGVEDKLFELNIGDSILSNIKNDIYIPDKSFVGTIYVDLTNERITISIGNKLYIVPILSKMEMSKLISCSSDIVCLQQGALSSISKISNVESNIALEASLTFGNSLDITPTNNTIIVRSLLDAIVNGLLISGDTKLVIKESTPKCTLSMEIKDCGSGLSVKSNVALSITGFAILEDYDQKNLSAMDTFTLEALNKISS